MSKTKVELSVGVLVCLGLLAFVFMAFRVSGLAGSTSSSKQYQVSAYFDNVSGLVEGAKVTFAGVTVGRVQSISIEPKSSKAKVLLALNEQANYISTDATAVVQTAGILGEKYIGLTQGAESEVLAAGSEIFDTQSSLILEDLIGKLVMAFVKKDDK
jgi:phospholipid/cholesterol/gamma-HCH transport system substrate-binding protein